MLITYSVFTNADDLNGSWGCSGSHLGFESKEQNSNKNETKLHIGHQGERWKYTMSLFCPLYWKQQLATDTVWVSHLLTVKRQNLGPQASYSSKSKMLMMCLPTNVRKSATAETLSLKQSTILKHSFCHWESLLKLWHLFWPHIKCYNVILVGAPGVENPLNLMKELTQ